MHLRYVIMLVAAIGLRAATDPAQHHSDVVAKKKRVAHPTWRAGQTAPTPERYKEIQDALAKKGYLHTEPNGKWDQDSTDALRRFQQDQNLESNGKLDSLSIIALGLGPKHEAESK